MANLKSRDPHRSAVATGSRPSGPQPITTAELVRLIQRIPTSPRPLAHPKNWTVGLRSVRDYFLLAPPWPSFVGSFFGRYPRPFERITFKSLDGTRLSAWMGRQAVDSGGGKKAPQREGVLIIPGMFSSKDNILHRARALTIFREWGYHVLAMDLRGFGQSKRLHNTGGWRESDDVIAGVREFRRRVPLGTLHIYAESLGASAALIAAARVARQGERLTDGRLLAFSPYGDMAAEARYLSERPLRTPEYYMVQWFFLQLLHLGGSNYKDFLEYSKAAAAAEGVPVEELYELSSAKNFVRDVNIPALIVHSYDDPVVPASDADELERTIRDLDNPIVWRLPWGNHCLYELLDPDWFWSVLRAYFDFSCPVPRTLS